MPSLAALGNSRAALVHGGRLRVTAKPRSRRDAA